MIILQSLWRSPKNMLYIYWSFVFKVGFDTINGNYNNGKVLSFINISIYSSSFILDSPPAAGEKIL